MKTAEEITKIFNTDVLPVLDDNIASTTLCEALATSGLKHKIWPKVLEDIGYFTRCKKGKGLYIKLPKDPANVSGFRPLTIHEVESALSRIKDINRTRKHTWLSKQKQALEDAKQKAESSILNEGNAIQLLKELGYKILKPVVQYDEI